MSSNKVEPMNEMTMNEIMSPNVINLTKEMYGETMLTLKEYLNETAKKYFDVPIIEDSRKSRHSRIEKKRLFYMNNYV